MVQVGDVVVSFDVLKECFCCDLEACHGQCCVEGDAGAPLLMEEIAQLEGVLPDVEPLMTPEARDVVSSQGVCYTDPSGDLVTSIVNGRDCVFCHHGTLPSPSGTPFACTLCLLEEAWRERGCRGFMKPVSCHLYPIRVGYYGAYYALNYNRWDVCECAVRKGRSMNLPVYRFLREPLVRRFGQEWYDELCLVADELKKQGII